MEMDIIIVLDMQNVLPVLLEQRVQEKLLIVLQLVQKDIMHPKVPLVKNVQ